MKRNAWLILATVLTLSFSALANIALLNAESAGEVAFLAVMAVVGLVASAGIGAAWAERF